MTHGVQEEIAVEEVIHAIQRHAQCDWGDLDAEDRQANDRALTNSDRLLSVYQSSTRVEFYMITESDRSVTTALLPSEY